MGGTGCLCSTDGKIFIRLNRSLLSCAWMIQYRERRSVFIKWPAKANTRKHAQSAKKSTLNHFPSFLEEPIRTSSTAIPSTSTVAPSILTASQPVSTTPSPNDGVQDRPSSGVMTLFFCVKSNFSSLCHSTHTPNFLYVAAVFEICLGADALGQCPWKKIEPN